MPEAEFKNASQIGDTAKTWLVPLEIVFGVSSWRSAQFEPVFAGSAKGLKLFKFGLFLFILIGFNNQTNECNLPNHIVRPQHQDR